jgi:chromosome transmission fidelity protein 1
MSSKSTTATLNTHSEAMRINPLIFALRMDNINLLHVVQYMEQSEIVKKVSGFLEKFSPQEVSSTAAGKETEVSETKALSPSLGRFQEFISGLSCGEDRDGRIVVTRLAASSSVPASSSSSPSLNTLPQSAADALSFRYVLLNPAIHFQEIVNEARAVILCGGTMQPFDHFVSQLFATLPPGK